MLSDSDGGDHHLICEIWRTDPVFRSFTAHRLTEPIETRMFQLRGGIVTISKVWTFNYFLIVVIVSFEANSLLFLLVMHCCNLLYIHGNINPYNPLKKTLTFIWTNRHACGILWNWARWQKKRTIEINNNNCCNLTLSIVILYHYVKMLNFMNFMSVQCYHTLVLG